MKKAMILVVMLSILQLHAQQTNQLYGVTTLKGFNGWKYTNEKQGVAGESFQTITAITSSGNLLYMADNGGRWGQHTVRLLKVELTTGKVTLLAGKGVAFRIQKLLYGDGDKVSFYPITGISLSRDTLYVMDFRTIRKVKITNGDVRPYITKLSDNPARQFVQHKKFFYRTTSKKGTIERINIDTKEVKVMVNDLKDPRGIIAHDGFLYVADSGNHRILKIKIADNSVTVLAGTKGKTGKTDGVGEDARFNYPLGLAYHNGYLFVTDYKNRIIRRITISNREVKTIAGSGIDRSFDGIGEKASFTEPGWITISDDGVIYVGDEFNRIGSLRKIVLCPQSKDPICNTLSTPELTQLGISIYPNPVDHYLTIDQGYHTTLQVEVIDNIGRHLSAYKTSSKLTNLDMSNYTSGIYYIRFTTDNGHRVVHRLIKE